MVMVGGARGGGGGVKAGEGSSPGNSIFLQGPWFDQLVTCVHSPDLGYGNTSLVIVFVYRRHSANWVYFSKWVVSRVIVMTSVLGACSFCQCIF